MNELPHIPVMLKETIDALNIQKSGVYVDATAGAGGHSTEIYKRINDGFLILIDRDPEAIELLKKKFSNEQNVKIVQERFGCLKDVLQSIGISKVDGIVCDLGLSTMQLSNQMRGFSHAYPQALVDMSMGLSCTAMEWLRTTEEKIICKAFEVGGDFTNVKLFVTPLLKAVKNDQVKSIDDLFKYAFEKKHLPKNVQSRFLQSIRIAVNDEINELNKILSTAREVIKSGGRLVIITFHSVEAQLVKQEFNAVKTNVKGQKNYYWSPIGGNKMKPSEIEIRSNPKSKSAIVRYATRSEWNDK